MRHTAESTPRRVAAFEIVADLAAEEIGDELVDFEVTPGVVQEVVRRMREDRGLEGVRPNRVRDWLGNPRQHDPTIDEVALERALAFDWPVIAALTAPERAELVDRLVEHPDPYAMVPRDPDNPGSGPSLRREAWLAGSEIERKHLIRAVQDRRGRIAAQAAA